MHELSIAQSVVQAVLESLSGTPACQILKVRLKIGALSGVDADAVRFCYDIATRDTRLEGSILDIETLAVIIRCSHCARDVQLPDPFRLRCTVCGTPSAQIVQGKELEIDSIEIQDYLDKPLEAGP